jgi:type II secretory pathway component PulF
MLQNLEHHLKPILRGWAKLTFDSTARARLYPKLAAMLDNGIKILVAIDSLYERTAKRGETETLTIVLADIRLTLNRGVGLSQALMPWADPTECMIIAAGEESGRLGEALRLAADSLGGVKEMRKAVLSGLAYPAMLFVATIATLYYVGASFIPQMSALGDPKQFTGTAASLYRFSDFVQSIWFWIVLAGIIGCIAAIVMTLPRAFGNDRFRVYLDKIPPWSVYRLVVGSGFLVSLSALLRAGVQLQEAIMQARKYASPYLEIRLSAILLGIRKGRMLGDALDEAQYHFPDREIIDDLITYSSLPNFDTVLYTYGQQWMTEGIKAVRHQASILQGLAFLVMASVIGWLVTGVMEIQQQLGAALQQIN